MTRSRTTVPAAACRFGIRMLMWSALGCSLLEGSLAAQGPRQFPADSAEAHLARNRSSVMHVHVDQLRGAPQFENVNLPPNLVVPTPLRKTFEAMLRDSPTFRRQCARLTNAPSISISVIVAANTRARAVTDFSVDRHGQTMARVQLGQRVDREEVIAHEFEHIIEQLDGVDLAAMAARNSTGVSARSDDGQYETERAVAAGQRVAQEVRDGQRREP
jgi:hypothetical protein